MLLTMDIGNTSCGVVLFADGKVAHRGHSPTPRGFTGERLARLIPDACRNRIRAAVVSSVVPGHDQSLRDSLQEFLGVQPRFIDHTWKLGMEVRVDEPAELGADRIADCAGALTLSSPPLIVIDSGTATTFDIIDEKRRYLGGTIFPGIELAFRSLAENTDKLGLVTFSVPDTMIGTTTETCIQAGVYYSHLGAITTMIDEYQRSLDHKATVIATGGLSRFFSNRIDGIHRYEPDLIYLGLRDLHQRNPQDSTALNR